MNLTIAIPTYNRCNKLDGTLNSLLLQIVSSKFASNITVFVSNNGSNDLTSEIIKKNEKIFKKHHIEFRYNQFKINEGFDTNIFKCYIECQTDYLWFLSDDDVINEIAINQIFLNLIQFGPNIIYYNFNQSPYTKLSPYISHDKFIEEFDINALKKIIDWPKLSSIVLKKFDFIRKSFEFNSGYAHIELIIKIYNKKGKLLLSNFFIGEPQIDYNENIDFPPYIGNNLNKALYNILVELNQLDIYEKLKIPYTDPIISTLNTLSSFYRGKHVLSNNLKKELEINFIYFFKKIKINTLLNYKFYFEIIKFIYSYSYYCILKISLKKNVSRLR